MHSDVFRHGATRLTDSSVLHAGLLQAGPSAMLSHASAARVLNLAGDHPLRPVHVTVGASVRVRDTRLRLHRTNTLPRAIVVEGLPVTPWPRAAVDVARTIPEVRRRAYLEGILQQGRVTTEQLYDELLKLRGQRGTQHLLAHVAALDPSLESYAESALAEALAAAGVAPGVAQHVVTDRDGVIGRADRAWPAERVLVEVDGYAWHSDRTSFTNDRRRYIRMTAAGWTVLPFSAADVLGTPEVVVATIAKTLASARAREQIERQQRAL